VTLHEIELVPTLPADACTQLTNSIHVYGSIALIERGLVAYTEYLYVAKKRHLVYPVFFHMYFLMYTDQN